MCLRCAPPAQGGLGRVKGHWGSAPGGGHSSPQVKARGQRLALRARVTKKPGSGAAGDCWPRSKVTAGVRAVTAGRMGSKVTTGQLQVNPGFVGRGGVNPCVVEQQGSTPGSQGAGERSRWGSEVGGRGSVPAQVLEPLLQVGVGVGQRGRGLGCPPLPRCQRSSRRGQGGQLVGEVQSQLIQHL